MENNATDLLREMEAALADLKDRVRAVEEQLDRYKALAAEAVAAEEPAPEEVDFTDMEIGVADLPAYPASAAPAPAPDDLPDAPEAPEAPAALAIDLPEDLPSGVPSEAAAEEPAAPVSQAAGKPASAPKTDLQRMAWWQDQPGLSVKNIRSGISLYDRALFIGTLFKEDYNLYDRTISDLNALGTLDEAVDYLLRNFPDWNLKSDVVYNFIMAIRKKLG